MGSIDGLLGTAGGVNGTGIAGPQNANIVNAATQKQADEQYGNVQQGLNNQAGFLQAIQAQNGLGNQTSVFNQLQGVANGTGPNPAQAQLAQSTAANNANQASLMASQRGSSANVGLAARNAAYAGGMNQQNAAGQAATMQAQQSLGALGQLGGIANQQAQQQANATNAYTSAAQGAHGQVLGAIAGQNNAAVANQSSINSANAGLANETMKGQQQMIGNLAGGAGAAIGLAKGGMVPKYAEGTGSVQAPAIAPPKGPRSNVGQFMNQDTSKQPQGMGMAGQTIGRGIGAGLNALGHGIAGMFGNSAPAPPSTEPMGMADPNADDRLAYGANSTPDQQALGQQAIDFGNQMDSNQPDAAGNDIAELGDTPMAAKGGKVPALVSPGEQYLPPKDVKKVVKDGKNPLSVGKKVPGKPKFPGNDYRNDTVKANLQTGGMVIPNEIMQSKDAAKKAAAFVAAHFKTLKKSK